MSPNRPIIPVKIAEAIKKPLITHAMDDESVPKSWRIVGRAGITIVWETAYVRTLNASEPVNRK
jgi:hypothetical protein